MAGNIKGITIELNGDTTKLDKALRNVNRETQTVQKQLSEVEKALKMDPGNTDLIKQKERLLGDEIKATKDKLEMLRKADEQVSRDMENGVEGAAEKHDELQRQIATTEAKEKMLQKEFDKLTKVPSDVEKIADSMAKTGEKVKDVGDKMKGVGKSYSKYVTAPLTALGVASVKSTMDFDSAMSQVAATMGVTNEEVQDLRDFAIQMGSTTAFSATEAAEALNYMALAGYSAEESMEMLPTVLNLAAAGNMDLAAASDMVTDSQTALGLSMEETETMVDQMAKTSSTTNTSVEQLGEAILTIGPTAKSMAGGTRELNQVLGILADNGIKGSEAGTHLRNIMLSFNTDKAKNAFKDLGVEIYDAEGNMRSFEDIFPELQKAMEGMSSEERTAFLSKIFNKTDLAAVNSLLDTSADRWDEVGEAIDNAGGAAEQMADTQLDNLGGSITLLKSALEGAGIAIGATLAPMLRKLADWLNVIVTKFNNLSPATQRVITIIGLLVAAVGPLLVIIGTLMSSVGSIMTMAPKLLAAFAGFNPMILVVAAAIAAIIAIGVLLYKNWDKIKAKAIEFRNAIVKMWNDLKAKVTGIVQGIQTAITGIFNAIKTKITSLVTGLVNGVVSAFNKLKSTASAVWNGIKTVMTSLISQAKANVVGTVNALRTSVISIVNAIKNAVSGSFKALKSSVASIWNGIKNAITSPIQAAKNTVSGIIKKIRGLFPLRVGRVFSNMKLPHFRISGGKAPWGIGGKGTKPTIGIDWYKQGAIFTRPTLFNTNSGTKGFGEAGAEAALPLDVLWDQMRGMFREMGDSIVNGVASAVSMQSAGTGGTIVINTYLYPSGAKCGEAIVDLYDVYKRRLG